MATSAPSRAKAIAAPRPMPEIAAGDQGLAAGEAAGAAVAGFAAVRPRLHLRLKAGPGLRLLGKGRLRIFVDRVLQHRFHRRPAHIAGLRGRGRARGSGISGLRKGRCARGSRRQSDAADHFTPRVGMFVACGHDATPGSKTVGNASTSALLPRSDREEMRRTRPRCLTPGGDERRARPTRRGRGPPPRSRARLERRSGSRSQWGASRLSTPRSWPMGPARRAGRPCR